MCKVAVTREVFDGLEAVRRTGLTDMLDQPVVARIARRLGHEAAASWVEDNPNKLGAGMLYGFEVKSEEKEG